MTIKAALIDLSGTLHVGDKAIPGATKAIRKLREAGIAVAFVSNTSRRPRAEVAQLLQTLSFDIHEKEILTAPQAAKALIRARNLRPHLLIHENLLPEFQDVDVSAPNCVLLGDAGKGFTYPAMNQAFRLLINGAPLITTGVNRYFRENEFLSLDAGPFVRALEYAANTKATLTGKPSAAFFQTALNMLNADAGTSVMIGDDAENDVAGAIHAGLPGILVRTGKYQKGDEHKAPDSRCFDDISAAVDALLTEN